MPPFGHWHGQTGSVQAGEIGPSDWRAGRADGPGVRGGACRCNNGQALALVEHLVWCDRGLTGGLTNSLRNYEGKAMERVGEGMADAVAASLRKAPYL